MKNNILKDLLKHSTVEKKAPKKVQENVFRSIGTLNVLAALGELYFVLPLMIVKQLSDNVLERK